MLPVSLKREIKDNIRREAEAIFLDAKRSLILGWYEFVAIISSPLYLLLTFILLSSFFIVYHLKLGGPILTVFQTAINYLSTPIGSGNSSDIKAKNE